MLYVATGYKQGESVHWESVIAFATSAGSWDCDCQPSAPSWQQNTEHYGNEV